MKIAIDGHCIGQKLTGNETYISNTILSLANVDHVNRYDVFYSPAQKVPGKLKLENEHFQDTVLNFNNPFLRLGIDLPRRLKKGKYDLLLAQYVAPLFCPVPYVLAIHDISYELFPQFFTKAETLRFKMTVPFSARHAKKIITCSENSKSDMVNLYKIHPDKIAVIPYGISDIFKQQYAKESIAGIKEKYSKDRDFILYVGNIQPRKNLKRLIKAFCQLKRKKMIDHKLVITGKKAWLYQDMFRSMQELQNTDDIVFTEYISNQELALLYQAADFFVYPALYEGFGFPVVEAMASGTPVITGDNSSLKEIAKDAALLVNAWDEEEIGSAILKLAQDRSLHAKLKEKGLERANKYTWTDTAVKTLEIFNEIGDVHR